MKPWGRLEQNYINHPKFLALSANAICLWHEGKNYCDMHQTDGLIPKEALRTFRFNGAKAVVLLTRSCGLKPAGQAYAPLWELFELGGAQHFKMHDYLDHNDCRDEVLQRLEDADDRTELRRLQNRDRQRLARLARKTELAALRHAVPSVTSRSEMRDRTRDTLTPTETETETLSVKEPQREKAPASLSPPADPFVNPKTTERAGRFLDRYELLYVKHRHGARYARKPMRDYAAAVTLCDTWADDGRLDKLATIFLTTDHKFAEEGSRTVPQFLALASWCDGKLAEHEAKARTA